MVFWGFPFLYTSSVLLRSLVLFFDLYIAFYRSKKEKKKKKKEEFDVLVS